MLYTHDVAGVWARVAVDMERHELRTQLRQRAGCEAGADRLLSRPGLAPSLAQLD
jgi:hypothetical protein